MPTYRRLADDEMDQFQSMVRYAFNIQEGPWTPPEDEDTDAGDDELGETYGYFDEDLVSVCRHYHWPTWVRDTQHPLVGLSAVASPPEYRRRGYVRDMLREALREYRADGDYLSVLWPFKHAFYRRLGWGTAFHGYSNRCDPGDLAAYRDVDDGDWVRLDADDWARLDPVHDAHGARFNLTIDRSEDWWRERIFEGWRQDPFVYGYERDGSLAAYVSVVASDDGDDTVLRTQDAAWVDQEAREAVYGFLARHEDQVDRVHLWTVDDDLLWQVDDPGSIEVTRHAAAMFRLVDVADALSALAYPPVLGATLDLAVTDPLVDWNDATFRVALDDGAAVVEQVGSQSSDADASLSIDALSQLYVGARDVEFLTRTGLLDATDSAAGTLHAMFPATPVLLREGF